MTIRKFDTFLITLGSLVFLCSLFLDTFYPGSPGIGFEQSAGMIVGCIVILMGLRFLFYPQLQLVNWALVGIYTAGLLIAGLRSGGGSVVYHNHLIGVDGFDMLDIVVNTGGFMPFGFLAMVALTGDGLLNKGVKKGIRQAVYVIAAGITVSLIIEVSQYQWVIGRFSSLYDLTSNTAGTVLGVLAYSIVGAKYSQYANHNQPDQ